MKGDLERKFNTLVVNTKTRSRKVDLVTLSELFHEVEREYRSTGRSRKDLGRDLHLSREMIREFLVAKDLPLEVKEIVKRREIDSVDTLRELGSIKDETTLIRFAKAIRGMGSLDIRELKRMVNYGGFTPEKARRTILEARDKSLHVFVMMLDTDVYEALNRRAKATGEDEVQMAQDILRGQLKVDTRRHHG